MKYLLLTRIFNVLSRHKISVDLIKLVLMYFRDDFDGGVSMRQIVTIEPNLYQRWRSKNFDIMPKSRIPGVISRYYDSRMQLNALRGTGSKPNVRAIKCEDRVCTNNVPQSWIRKDITLCKSCYDYSFCNCKYGECGVKLPVTRMRVDMCTDCYNGKCYCGGKIQCGSQSCRSSDCVEKCSECDNLYCTWSLRTSRCLDCDPDQYVK